MATVDAHLPITFFLRAHGDSGNEDGRSTGFELLIARGHSSNLSRENNGNARLLGLQADFRWLSRPTCHFPVSTGDPKLPMGGDYKMTSDGRLAKHDLGCPSRPR